VVLDNVVLDDVLPDEPALDEVALDDVPEPLPEVADVVEAGDDDAVEVDAAGAAELAVEAAEAGDAEDEAPVEAVVPEAVDPAVLAAGALEAAAPAAEENAAASALNRSSRNVPRSCRMVASEAAALPEAGLDEEPVVEPAAELALPLVAVEPADVDCEEAAEAEVDDAPGVTPTWPSAWKTALRKVAKPVPLAPPPCAPEPSQSPALVAWVEPALALLACMLRLPWTAWSCCCHHAELALIPWKCMAVPFRGCAGTHARAASDPRSYGADRRRVESAIQTTCDKT
jgi:hypothetical protein